MSNLEPIDLLFHLLYSFVEFHYICAFWSVMGIFSQPVDSLFTFIYLYFLIINFYASLVDLQCWVSSAVQKSESVANRHISTLFLVFC